MTPRLHIDDDIFPAEGSRAGRAWRRAWLVARGAPDRADLRSQISSFPTIGFSVLGIRFPLSKAFIQNIRQLEFLETRQASGKRDS